MNLKFAHIKYRDAFTLQKASKHVHGGFSWGKHVSTCNISQRILNKLREILIYHMYSISCSFRVSEEILTMTQVCNQKWEISKWGGHLMESWVMFYVTLILIELIELLN